MNTIKWALDSETRPQSDMCSSDSGRIMVYEVMKHKSKAYFDYDKITSGVRMHLFLKIAFQTKEIIWRKSHGETMDFTYFSRGLHSNTSRDIIMKGFNWIITLWGTQSHSCSWAIQHTSPFNTQYNNFEHTTTRCIIFTTSPDHVN